MSRRKRPEAKFALTLKVTSALWVPIPGAESMEQALAAIDGLKFSSLLRTVGAATDVHDYDIEVDGVHRA